MFELILCSSLTILPDYLFRRFVQGKRFGREITLYTMFYELRWGITTCIILTVLLITVILYNHPSTTSVLSLYRTVPVVPEINGRVAAVYVKTSQEVTKDTLLFKLDDSKQQAAVEVAKRQIAETDAAILAAKTDLATDDAKIQQATGEYNQAVDELNTKQTLYRRNPDVVARRDLERLQRTV